MPVRARRQTRPVVQTGSYGAKLGQVDLSYDADTGDVAGVDPPPRDGRHHREPRRPRCRGSQQYHQRRRRGCQRDRRRPQGEGHRRHHHRLHRRQLRSRRLHRGRPRRPALRVDPGQPGGRRAPRHPDHRHPGSPPPGDRPRQPRLAAQRALARTQPGRQLQPAGRRRRGHLRGGQRRPPVRQQHLLRHAHRRRARTSPRAAVADDRRWRHPGPPARSSTWGCRRTSRWWRSPTPRPVRRWATTYWR